MKYELLWMHAASEAQLQRNQSIWSVEMFADFALFYFFDTIHYLYPWISGSDGARIDFDTEYSFIGRIVRVTRLSSQTSLDNHPELLSFFLPDCDLHEPCRKRIVLDRQLDNLAGLEQRHDGFLMRHIPDICRVHGQDPVSHPQLASGRGRATGYDLTDIDSLKMFILIQFTSTDY